MNELTRKLSRGKAEQALDSQHHRRARCILTVLLDFLYTKVSMHLSRNTVFQIYIIQCSDCYKDSVKGKRHRIDYW